MTALDSNPTTHDNLLPNRFRLGLKRAPNTEFWCQAVALPGFSIAPTAQATPFVEIPKPGDHIEYDPLGVTIIVDNEFANYLELYTWAKSLGFPDNFDQYASLLANPPILDEGLTSEVTVFILNGQQQPKFRWVFHDAFPYAVGGMELVDTDQDLQRVVCHFGFKYTSFDIYPVT